MKTAMDRRKPPQFPWRDALGARPLVLASSAAVLVFAPLAYGAVHPWAYTWAGFALALSSLILLGWTAFSAISPQGQPFMVPRPPLWGLVLAAGLLAVLQVVPLPREVVGWLSPQAIEIRSLGNGYGLAPLIPLSLNSNATVQELLRTWPAVVLFFLLVSTVNSRRQIQALVYLLLGLALFEAFYGLWHFRSHLIWGWKNPFYPGRLCGTFINSNHVAGYLGMAILLGFGLFLARGAGGGPEAGGRRGRSWLRFWSRAELLEPLVRRSCFFLILLVLIVAFFFAASRGAILALGVSLALMVLLWGSQRPARWPMRLLAFFLVGVFLYCLWLGGAWVFARFLDLSDQGRTVAFWGSLHLFREFPLVGSGLGTFDDLSSGFMPGTLSRSRLIYAHNDWVQLLAEMGLPGFLLVGGGWLFFYVSLMRVWRRRRDGWAQGLGLGGLAALAAGAFHALLEFPFHIPAFSLTYAAIAALTFLILHYHPAGEHFSYAAWRPSGKRLTPWVCLFLALLQLAYVGQAWFSWQAERAAPLEIDSTRIPRVLGAADYSRAIALNPRNAGYYAGLAQTLGQNQSPDLNRAQEIDKLRRQAIFRAPARWLYHFQLGAFLCRYYRLAPGRYLPQGLRELAAAVTLFPEKAELHLNLGRALAWTEHHYFGYVPEHLIGRAQTHLQKAAALEPTLHKFLTEKGQ